MSLALNQELMSEYDIKRYNITLSRIKTIAKLMGFNPDNVLNLPQKENDVAA